MVNIFFVNYSNIIYTRHRCTPCVVIVERHFEFNGKSIFDRQTNKSNSKTTSNNHFFFLLSYSITYTEPHFSGISAVVIKKKKKKMTIIIVFK